jgi:hypothetical protein
MQTHLFSYRFDGKLWELEIKANSADEAKARLSQLAFAKYDGTLVATIPASLGAAAIVAIWIRNAAAKLIRRF